MRGSELFTGAALDGLGQDPHDDELALHPIPRRSRSCPGGPTVAWTPGNLHLHGEPWPMCSRTVCSSRSTAPASSDCVSTSASSASSSSSARDGDRVSPANPKMVLHKAAYDVVGLLESIDWLDEIVGHMDQLGWNVHCFDHEDANSQFEIDFEYADCLTTADRYILLRLMMKEIARRHGFEVTLMPKPLRTGPAAPRISTCRSPRIETGENLFADASDRARHGPVEARLPVHRAACSRTAKRWWRPPARQSTRTSG